MENLRFIYELRKINLCYTASGEFLFWLKRRLSENIIAVFKLFKYLLGYSSQEKLDLLRAVPKGKTKADEFSMR